MISITQTSPDNIWAVAFSVTLMVILLLLILFSMVWDYKRYLELKRDYALVKGKEPREKESTGYVIIRDGTVVYHPIVEYLKYLYPDMVIKKVKIYEDPEGQFYGWWDTRGSYYPYIDNTVRGVTINLPYDYREYEAKGEGCLVPVELEVIETIDVGD